MNYSAKPNVKENSNVINNSQHIIEMHILLDYISIRCELILLRCVIDYHLINR